MIRLPDVVEALKAPEAMKAEKNLANVFRSLEAGGMREGSIYKDLDSAGLTAILKSLENGAGWQR